MDHFDGFIVQFLSAYGWCQKAVAKVAGRESTKELNLIENASAGFLAAFFSSFPLCPTELIKCKLQAMRETQVNMLADHP